MKHHIDVCSIRILAVCFFLGMHSFGALGADLAGKTLNVVICSDMQHNQQNDIGSYM
jgi:hypothetical protein